VTRALALAALVAALAVPASAPAASKPKPADVSVMTRNMYLGANPLPLATTAGEDFEREAGRILDAVDRSQPNARMKLMAREIVKAKPDFVNLQEVTAWYTGDKGDPAPARVVRWDYLMTLRAELKELGAGYRVAAASFPLDIEGSTDRGVDVRFKTGNVILVRKGVTVERAKSGSFKAQFEVPTQAIGTVETTRGWNYVDFRKGTQRGRVVNAHPEAFSTDVRLAQTKELVKGALRTKLRVILAGDMNTGPDLPKAEDRPPYFELTKAGLVDRRTPKFNCCFNDDLRTGTWDHIVDRIMTRPKLPLVRSFIGSTKDTTPSGLLASDHGAVTSVLRLR
jgi:endonuclease/exonuclease/phosphatase family metal-dependent hydrolase